MTTHRCLRCQHDVATHGKRGGPCNKVTYTREYVYDGDRLDEIVEDASICRCPYLLLGA